MNRLKKSVAFGVLVVIVMVSISNATGTVPLDLFSRTPVESFTIQRPIDLVFTNGNKTVFTIKQDGLIILGEGFTADDAARSMWKLMEYHLRAIATCQEPK